MAGHSNVQYVSFYLSGDKEHVRDSHALINSTELFATNGQPVSGGIYDLKLGTTDHSFHCTTCSHGKKLCPGHRGHIELKVSVLQPAAISEVRKWLKIVCFKCGNLLVEKEKFMVFPRSKRLSEASGMETAGKKCSKCETIHPKIVKDDEDYFTFWAETNFLDKKPAKGVLLRAGEKRGDKLYPDTIGAIFSRVSEQNVENLGKSLHPRNLVIRFLVIPPNTIRPGVKSFGGSSNSYHDSTNILQSLIKKNQLLPDKLPDNIGLGGPGGVVPPDLDKSIQNVQQLYFDLVVGSNGTSATQGNSGKRGLVLGGRAVNSFLRNIPRKEGRIRWNLFGKRTFYISRTTISGNSRFKIDEVGIPIDFAKILQVKETVQSYNREWLMTFFLNGHDHYPGCTQIIRNATGQTHDVSGLKDTSLEIGDIIFRDCIDGDIAYFGRQPTLERSSIGVHRIIVIQDPGIHTFQMNVLACEWYNADFDGDQMNLWVSRNAGARAEAAILSSVSNLFISTKNSGPVNGQVQDSVVGCYELTKGSVRIDKYHAMGLFTGIESPRFDDNPSTHIYTGRDIVSLLFKSTPINYRRAPSSYSDVYAPYIHYDPTDVMTVMEHGKLLSGVLDKRAIGAKSTGGLFHLIGREFGSQKALEMIHSMQQISLQYLLYSGFSVGTADLIPTIESIDEIHKLISCVKLESQVITNRLFRGEIVPPIGMTIHEFYEELQINALKIPEADILRWILHKMKSDTNGFFKMVAVGSKGNNPNLIHVSGAIGQTTINGSRISEKFAFRRTLPYYPRFSTDPAAYGFVENSYITGMNTGEYTFQDMNGRYDLINKALSTATTGYFMRKGVMNNQSSITDNYRRVTKDTKIVQMLYGEDGLDARELEKVEFRTVLLSDKKLREFALGDDSQKPSAAALAFLDQMIEDRDYYRRVFSRMEMSTLVSSFTTEILMPVNVKRIVDNVLIDSTDGGNEGDEEEKINLVNDLCQNISYTLVNEIQERKKSKIPKHKLCATILLRIVIRAEMNPRIMKQISVNSIKYIIDAIRHRYSISLIDYGTAVGILAAQSISQPMTQYMLDSHHRSVAGGTSKSGIIRIGEIYGAKSVKDEQTASMLLPLMVDDISIAQEIANSIEFVTFQRFVKQYDIILESYDNLIYPAYASDASWIKEYENTHILTKIPGDLTNWCFRFVLDKSNMVLKSVELELIVRKIRSKHLNVHVVHTPESVPEIIIRIWIKATQFKRSAADEEKINEFYSEIMDTPIRGISGIMQAKADKITRMVIADDNSMVKKDQIIISTSGTNLYNVMMHSAVDKLNTVSSSVGDTFKLFGIEAARTKIINETRAFMEDSTPNLRHLFIYADEMTRTGKLTSVERGGLSAREHGNVLLRMGYGAPIQVVTDATLANARSRIYGIAAPLILGGMPQLGSIYNNIIVDEDFVKENFKSVDSVLDDL